MQALKENNLGVAKAMKNPFETQAALDEKRVHFNDPIEVLHRRKMERDMMTEFLEEEAKEAAKRVPAHSTL